MYVQHEPITCLTTPKSKDTWQKKGNRKYKKKRDRKYMFPMTLSMHYELGLLLTLTTGIRRRPTLR